MASKAEADTAKQQFDPLAKNGVSNVDQASILGCCQWSQIIETIHLNCGRGFALRRMHPVFPISIGDLYFTDEPDQPSDWLVMAQHVREPVETIVPVSRRILLATEPNGYFPPDFTRQFGIIITSFNAPGFDGVQIAEHGAHPCRLGLTKSASTGLLDYRGLADLPVPDKADRISVVTSRKSILPGHRQRLAFLRQASAAFGSRIDIYGRGIRPIADKADVILPSKYHLVLENTVQPAYWTEKLTDALVGHAFPFVIGPPDLERWFPPESFMRIDIGNPADAIATLQTALDTDLYNQRTSAVAEARHRLLTKESLSHVIARVVAAHRSEEPALRQPITVQPEPRPPLAHRMRREISRTIWQADALMRPVRIKADRDNRRGRPPSP